MARNDCLHRAAEGACPGLRFRLAIPFLLALPHFGFLLVILYPVPLASALIAMELLLVLAIETQRGFFRLGRGVDLSARLSVFWLYCLASAVFGYLSLRGSGRDILQLAEGDVSYLSVSTGRIVQLTLAFAAFEFVRRTRHDVRAILRAWLLGSAVATLIHAVGWTFPPDLLAARAGTFPEGNQAGLYYLLSLFVALEYGRLTVRRTALVFAACAIFGLFMSRSTAGLLALAISLGLRACRTRGAYDREACGYCT